MSVNGSYNKEYTVDPVNHIFDLPNHDGSAKGLSLAGTVVTLTAAKLNNLAAVAASATTTTTTELNQLHSQGAVAADFAKLHAITATAAQVNTVAVPGVVTLTAGALTAAANGLGKTNIHSAAAGVAVTLPAATGSGARFKIVIRTAVATSNLTITTFAGDFLVGSIFQSKASADVINYAANGSSHHIITLDGSTMGGQPGDWIELVDAATGLYLVTGWTLASGTVASPIS